MSKTMSVEASIDRTRRTQDEGQPVVPQEIPQAQPTTKRTPHVERHSTPGHNH